MREFWDHTNWWWPESNLTSFCCVTWVLSRAGGSASRSILRGGVGRDARGSVAMTTRLREKLASREGDSDIYRSSVGGRAHYRTKSSMWLTWARPQRHDAATHLHRCQLRNVDAAHYYCCFKPKIQYGSNVSGVRGGSFSYWNDSLGKATSN